VQVTPALAGLLTIAALLALILTRRASPLVALIVVPVAAALATGAGLKTGTYILQGIASVAPMAAMFIFAIAFFGVVGDAGMFDPIIRGLLRLVGTNPVRIMLGTATLAFLAHLDGNGAVTFSSPFPRCCRCSSGSAWTAGSSPASRGSRPASASCRGPGPRFARPRPSS
jgi:CitMHS family citrate-Mg2+:H+ or citrate-Ca2+:H+ symporter